MEPKSTAFVIQPFGELHRAVFDLISEAAARSSVRVWRSDSIKPGDSIVSSIHSALRDADCIIADVSDANPNVMYELGFARSSDKPIILIANDSRNIPFDLYGVRILIYDLTDPQDFVRRLSGALAEGKQCPDLYRWSNTVKDRSKRNSVFISYSHNDDEYLERLLVHLKPLEREGLLELWVDKRIRAGDRWKDEIERALGRACVAVLLVSADFLASDFIVDNELPPLLRDAEDKGTRIIPLILKPCRFARDPLLRHFQAVNDPSKALILATEGEQEILYDQVSAEIERTLDKG